MAQTPHMSFLLWLTKKKTKKKTYFRTIRDNKFNRKANLMVHELNFVISSMFTTTLFYLQPLYLNDYLHNQRGNL